MSTLKWLHEGGNKLPMHYWISNKHGYLLSSSKYCPAKGSRKKNGKISYIGFTLDESWPKRMNTGRLYYAEPPKKKPSVGHKTASESIGKTNLPVSASNGEVTR